MPGDGRARRRAGRRPLGLTVLPGLIDTHSHLVGDVQTAGVPATTTSGGAGRSCRRRNARVTLEAGFTTVRDLGPFRAFVDCALRDAIDAGEVEGPRMQCAGAFITAPWGGGDVVGLAHDIRLPEDLRFGVVTPRREVRDRVRRLLIGGADLIKCIGTGAVLTRGGVPGAPELSEDELRAAVEEAAHYDAFVAVHAHGAEGAKRAIRAGARSVEHGSIPRRRGDRDARRHRHVLRRRPVRRRMGARARRPDGWPAETMRKLAETKDRRSRRVRRGGRGAASGSPTGPTAASTRTSSSPGRLDAFVRYGMTPLGAIRSATPVAAECLGWSDRVGTPGRGRFADLVAVEGDPLADIRVLERRSS